VLWLRGETLLPQGPAAVEVWEDQSGYGHQAAVVPFPPGMPRSDPPPDRRPVVRDGDEGLHGLPVLAFDGQDDLLGIADADLLNTGGPYARRTIFLVIRTGPDVERRQMIFETGGDLRGFNVYLDAGLLYLGAYNVWNDDRGRTTPFGPLAISAPVRPLTPYLVTLEFDQPRGALRGFLNGRMFGSSPGAGRVFVHHEDIGIGAINEDTYYHDGVRQGVPTGDHFGGELAELLLYNAVLDDAERERTDLYLANRYGLDVSPPGHQGGGPAAEPGSVWSQRVDHPPQSLFRFGRHRAERIGLRHIERGFGARDRHLGTNVRLGHHHVARQQEPDRVLGSERAVRQRRITGAEDHVRSEVDPELLLQGLADVNAREDAETLALEGRGGSLHRRLEPHPGKFAVHAVAGSLHLTLVSRC
jgi:hypothetical protein